MIELRNLSHGYLRKSLFQDVNIRFLPEERYGIVGANGSGKSTLLKIIASEIDADQGEVDIMANRELFSIGQDYNLNDTMPIIDTAMMGQAQVFDAIKRKEILLQEKNYDLNIAAEITRLEEIIESHQGYRLRSRAQSILEGLGIKTENHEEPLKILSGGFKWRVFLAQALVKSPDILLLDEPTNHLDIVSIRWLELFLSTYQGLVVLVSHDKRFMDHVCTQILDIDFDTITAYAGNFSAFERARSLFLLQKEKEILAQEKEIKKQQAFIDRFRYKASKARQAQSRIKQLDKIEIIEPIKSSRLHPKFKLEVAEVGSKEVLTVKNLSKAYGDHVIINDFSFAVQRKDKVAIIGPNGSGKSTLIKALAMEFPECQKAIKWGYGVNFGYFAQDAAKKIRSCDETILEWFWKFCADKPQSFVQGMLGRVLFTGEDAKKNTKSLSGGEVSRLYLAHLMMQKPNVLMLDEPTNHLDLESIDSLTQALVEYPGTLIFVSHDRTFIDNIASRVIELQDQGIQDFLGNYSEFVASQKRDYLDVISKEAAPKSLKITANKINYEEQKKRRGQSQKLHRDLEKTMQMVEEAEAKIADIERNFASDDFFKESDFNQINQMEAERAQLKDSLAILVKDWERLLKELNEISE